MGFGAFATGAALAGVPIIGPGLAAAQWARMGKRRQQAPEVQKGEKTIGATDKSTGRGGAIALTNVATDAELQAVRDWTQRELDADETRLDAIEAQLAAMAQPQRGGGFGGGGGLGGILPLLLLTGGLGTTSSTIDTTTLVLLFAFSGGF